MPRGQKHLIDCRCILPQNRGTNNFHKFIVFSVIDDDDNVIPSFAQCNHCGVVHRVSDICTSEIISRESMATLPTIEEIKISLPDKLTTALSRFERDMDLPTWQNIGFVYENQLLGQPIIINKDCEGHEVTYKVLTILGQNLFKIDTRITKEIA